MADQQRAAKGEDIACAAEVEAGAIAETGCHHHADGAGPEDRDRRKDKRPNAIATEREHQRNACPRQCRQQVDDGRLLELQVPRHQRLGQDQEGCGEKDQCLPAQHVGNNRLAIIGRRQGGCDEYLDQREAAVQQDHHPERLPDADFLDMFLLDQRADKAVAVQEIEEHQHRRRHRKQPVIMRVEDAQHRECHPPADDLRDNLRPRTPQNRAFHAASEIGGKLLCCHRCILHEVTHSANRLPKGGGRRAGPYRISNIAKVTHRTIFRHPTKNRVSATAFAARSTEPITSSARMERSCCAGVQPLLRLRSSGTAGNARSSSSARSGVGEGGESESVMLVLEHTRYIVGQGFFEALPGTRYSVSPSMCGTRGTRYCVSPCNGAVFG